MTVFFHGNFGLNRKRMSDLVRLALKHPSRNDADLAKPFGYGAPFATRYRYWLNKTGIANLGRPLTLTESGNVVWEHDPDFEHTVTKWFMHHELTTDPDRAEAWFYFFREFRPRNKSFTRADLNQGLMVKMRHHHEAHFGPNSKMNPVIVRKLIDCYTNPDGLGDLGLVRSHDQILFRFEARRELGPWRSPAQLARAYGEQKN